VIANLAVYFAVHILFRTTGRRTWGPIAIDLPHLDTIRPIALTVAVIAAVLIFAIKWSVLRTLGVCAAIGLLLGVTGIHP
jgi:chromate transporter